MAKKKAENGAAEETALAAAEKDHHAELQDARRSLEAEMAVIDDQIRGAISGGDAAALTRLTVRKAELPRLFIEASMAETAARQEMAAEREAANLEAYHAAEEACEKVRAEMVAKRAEFEALFRSLNAALFDAESTLNTARVTLQNSRNLASAANGAFQASLAALAGV